MSDTRPAEGLAHGGRLSEAGRRFPNARLPWIDLSTGINPVPYPIPNLPPECFTRLPEPDALAALQAIAATAYGAADPAMVVAAPGTQILIDLLPRLFPLRSIAVLGPTYAEHAQAWTRTGRVVPVTDFASLAACDGAVLCNPNNPDGRRIPRDALLALADSFAARGGLLLVDEAFVDLAAAGMSIADALPHPAVIVLRSFGKTYGLAGLRLGFALASPQRADLIRSSLGPWAVSGPAIAIGSQALADHGWLNATAQRLATEAEWLDTVLIQAGLTIVGGTSLFRLAASDAAAKVFEQLGRAGIFVRRFADQPSWLRFGLPPDPNAWQRLQAALAGG